MKTETLKSLFGDRDRLVRMREWVPLSGHCRSAIYVMIASGHHPKPLKIGKRTVAWRASTLIDWLEERERQVIAPSMLADANPAQGAGNTGK